MKITLEFDNIEEAQLAINGSKYAAAIFEYDQYLRSKLKYETLPEDMYIAYDDSREKLRSHLSEHNLFIDDYISF
jgi:hypothetical protein